MRPMSAPASAVGSGAPVALRPLLDPAGAATSLASPLNCTSPDVLNESTSPFFTVIPVDVHACRGETEMPGAGRRRECGIGPRATHPPGVASTIRAISDEDAVRSPELVLNVILSGDVPPIS